MLSRTPLQRFRDWRKPDYLHAIRRAHDWERLSYRMGGGVSARTRTLKVLVDRHSGDRLYCINSQRWRSHFDFVQAFIDPYVHYDRFNATEYVLEDRRFVLASVTHHLDGDHWTVELNASDTLSAAGIARLMAVLGDGLTLPGPLAFLPLSQPQVDRARSLGEALRLLDRDQINASTTYQPIVVGVAHGHLRIDVEGQLDVMSLRPSDILVCDEVPLQIPPLAGLVTRRLQAPLAHAAVLCRSRNTPDMALRDAGRFETLRQFDGQLVKLSVGSQDFAIEPCSAAAAEAAWAALRPARATRPRLDTSVRDLRPVTSLSAADLGHAGAKATQLADLARLEGVATAPGFTVPAAAYLDHLETSGAAALLEPFLGSPPDDLPARGRQLAAIRDRIMQHPVAPALLSGIEAMLPTLGPARRYILRSSSNAEDLAGFSGAGLYESVPTRDGGGTAGLADALREVWASVWLQRAYEEREWFRIEQSTVAMAVLVQPFLEEAVATGVAITENPFRQQAPAVYINTQVRGASVTGAGADELPEQYLVSTEFEAASPELLARSSLAPDGLLLQNDEAARLALVLRRIHEQLLPPYQPQANAMDVEFALMPDRSLVFLQARPYTIVYSLDRAIVPLSWWARFVAMRRRVTRGLKRLLTGRR